VRQLTIAIMMLVSATVTLADEQQPDQGTGGRGYFGAPVVKYALVRDQGTVMFGGRGGWNVTPSVLMGIGAYGTVTEVDAPQGAMPDSLGPMDVKFESFGFELEYAANPQAPTHLTLGAFFGGAAVHYMQERTTEQYGETDFLLLLEPAVGVEQRINAWLHLNLAVTYRLVSGVEQPGLENGDINGPAAALAFKFAQF
jgi:hypothetical protein